MVSRRRGKAPSRAAMRRRAKRERAAALWRRMNRDTYEIDVHSLLMFRRRVA